MKAGQNLEGLRTDLLGLAGHHNALIRSAVRIAINELNLADIATDPTPHLTQVTRIIDALLNPDTNTE